MENYFDYLSLASSEERLASSEERLNIENWFFPIPSNEKVKL